MVRSTLQICTIMTFVEKPTKRVSFVDRFCRERGMTRYLVRGRCGAAIPLVPLTPPPVPGSTPGAFSQAFSVDFDRFTPAP